jgi:hypothetical protein
MERLSASTVTLGSDEEMRFESSIGSVKFNKDFKIDRGRVDELLRIDQLDRTTEAILRVKKPDYLGRSMWESYDGEHILDARISDARWLEDFQHRRVDVRPGDAIRVRLRVVINYGPNEEILYRSYEITEVLEVLQGFGGEETHLGFAS